MSRIFRAHFQVAGIPGPKGSRIVGVRKDGSHYTREASKRAAPWTEQVAWVARVQRPGGKPLEPPYLIELVFAMPRPEEPKYAWPSKDGDLDKLCRSTLDGLVRGGLILDDRHVCDLSIRKRFAVRGAEPGVGIAIV